jgi:hypothetical protein
LLNILDYSIPYLHHARHQPGHERFRRTLVKNLLQHEAAELRTQIHERVGGDFDPEASDIAVVNRALAGLQFARAQ